MSFRSSLLFTVVPLVAVATGVVALVSYVYDLRVIDRFAGTLPRAQLIDLLREQRAWHLVLVLLLIAVAAGVAFGLAQRIAGPLRRLQAQAHAVAAGGPLTAIPEEGPAELRALAADFNRMAAAVAARETDLTAANAELARSQTVFRGLFEHTSDLVTLFRVPPDGGPLVCEAANPATLTAAGLTREQVIGRTFRANLPDDEADRLEARFREAVTTGRPVRYEQQITLKTGERWFNTVVIPLPGPDGRVGLVASVSRDMTEERKAGAAVREYQERLELHRRHTPLGMIHWDPAFRVLAWNPAAERIFGYPADQALGRHAGFIVPEEARPQVDRVWADLIAQRGGRRSTNLNLTADGRRIECEWYNTPLVDGGGTVIGVASVVQDVTADRQTGRALRDSEAFLAGLVESATDPIVAVDDQDTVLLFNAAAERVFGVSADQAFGRPVGPLLPDALCSLSGSRLVTARRGDGTEFPAELSAFILEAGGRRVCAAIVRDRSDRVRAEAEAHRRTADLERRLAECTARFDEVTRELTALAGEPGAEAVSARVADLLRRLGHTAAAPAVRAR